MNRYNFFGTVTIAGILVTTFGALRKILHTPGADTFLSLGLCLEAIGISALCWLIFMRLKKKNNSG